MSTCSGRSLKSQRVAALEVGCELAVPATSRPPRGARMSCRGAPTNDRSPASNLSPASARPGQELPFAIGCSSAVLLSCRPQSTAASCPPDSASSWPETSTPGRRSGRCSGRPSGGACCHGFRSPGGAPCLRRRQLRCAKMKPLSGSNATMANDIWVTFLHQLGRAAGLLM